MDSRYVPQLALPEKELERSMLKEIKERMLPDLENGEKLFAHFMDFVDAVENNDPEIAQKFDEKAMKDSALTMIYNYITNYSGNGGGLGSVYGGVYTEAEGVATEGTEIDDGEDSDVGEN